MRSSLRGEPVARGLEHDAHRGGDLLQARDLLVAHHPGVQVRQQSRLLDHADGDGAHVVEGGVEPTLVEPRPRDLVAVLRTIAEREERFLAAGLGTCASDRDRFLGREERSIELRRRFRERAVVTVIAAQHRERHEHLARVRHDLAVAQVAKPRGDGEQSFQVGSPRLEQRRRLVEAERHAPVGSREGSAQLGAARPRGSLGHVGEPTTLLRDEGRGARGRDRRGEVPARSLADRGRCRPHGGPQHRRRRRGARPARQPGPRLRDLLARRCVRSRPWLGSA